MKKLIFFILFISSNIIFADDPILIREMEIGAFCTGKPANTCLKDETAQVTDVIGYMTVNTFKGVFYIKIGYDYNYPQKSVVDGNGSKVLSFDADNPYNFNYRPTGIYYKPAKEQNKIDIKQLKSDIKSIKTLLKIAIKNKDQNQINDLNTQYTDKQNELNTKLQEKSDLTEKENLDKFYLKDKQTKEKSDIYNGLKVDKDKLLDDIKKEKEALKEKQKKDIDDIKAKY